MNIYDFVQRRVLEKKVHETISEKYRPRSLADLSGLCSDMAVLCMNQWIRTRPKRFLMVSGPSGIGKTTIVRLALAEAGYVLVDLPCSIVKTAKDFEVLVRCVTDLHACIVDELDVVEAAIGTAIKDFAKARPKVPIVFVCQKHAYGKPMDFAKASEVVQLRRPNRTRLVEWVQTIVRKESIESIDAASLVDQSKGDISQILVTLEMNRGQTKTAALISKKDPPLDAIGTVEMLMCSASPMTASLAMRLTSLDPTIVGSMVSENYVDVATDIGRAAEAAEALSVADVMENQMYGHQCWELWDPWTFFGAVYPASRVRRQSTHAVRFTKIWSKLSNMYLRKGYLSSLKATVGLGLDSDYVYALSRCMFATLVSNNGAGAETMVSVYGRLVPYELVTFVLRLSMKTELKQAAINKIKAAYKTLA